MLVWLSAVAAIVGASVAVAIQIGRQGREIGRLRDRLFTMQESFDLAIHQFAGLEASRGPDILDSMEDDDSEMASNIGRLNLLLDQLNGLLHGSRGQQGYERHMCSGEEQWSIPYPGPVEFENHEELRKFIYLPPISDDEITEADWDGLFRRIQKDDLD